MDNEFYFTEIDGQLIEVKIPTNLELLNKIKNQTNLEEIPLKYLRIELQTRKDKEMALSKIYSNTEDGKIKPLGENEVIKVINRQINIIEAELSRLASEKTADRGNGAGERNDAKNKVLAYNNDADEAWKKINLILNQINGFLFVDSKETQWRQILNSQTPETPIICKSHIDISCLTVFCEKLCNVRIFRPQYKKTLASLNAFHIEGKTINKSRQFTDGLQYAIKKPPAISDELNEIFKVFKQKT